MPHDAPPPRPASTLSAGRDERQFPRVPVVFADEHIIVVDKPAGIPSVPARTSLDPRSVPERMAGEWGWIEAAHRLDRDTSGLLVLARSRAARASLGRAFESRHVRKRYLAIVGAAPPRSEGIVHLPLAADPWRPPRQRIDPISGRLATTRWTQLAGKVVPRGWASLLEVEPLTGRSHQLRAHLAWLGMPILGDRLYGGRDVREAAELRGDSDPPPSAARRMALHAFAIAFPHPTDGRPIELVAPAVAEHDQDPWSLFVKEGRGFIGVAPGKPAVPSAAGFPGC